MFKLLNRFAWGISLVLGFIIVFSYIGLESYKIDAEEMLLSIFFGTILGFIIKKILFSEDFIKSRLNFFAKRLEERILENNNIVKKVEKTEKIEEKEKIINNIEIIEEETNKENYETKEFSINDAFQDNLKEQTIENYAENVKNEEEVEIEKVSEPSKFEIAFKNFFKENLLAKIGSILVFIGVLFLLSFVWNVIPSILKLIIGFTIGFSIYFIGVFLDKKGIVGESRILLGTGILINFLVILGGKYLLSGIDDMSNSSFTAFLSTSMTFFLLILNTIFAIITSLIYKSKTLLTFSFIFAYLNPFLLGESSNTPYTLVGYSIIISLGALFIGKKENSYSLKIIAFTLGNILFLLAPFNTEIGWTIKFLASAFLGVLTLYDFQKNHKNHLYEIFIGIYLFLFFLLGYGTELNIFGGILSYFSYLFIIIFLFGFSVFLIMKNTLKTLNFILFGPIILILFSLFYTNLSFAGLSIGIITMTYLIGFSFILNIVSVILKYIYFAVLGIFIIIGNSYLSISGNLDFNFYNFIIILLISFVFFFKTYFLSKIKDLEFLYPLGTIATILMLTPILPYNLLENFSFFNNNTLIISVLSIIIFSLFNTIFPFFNKNLTGEKANIKSLISGNIIGIIFTSFMLFSYGNNYFPGVSLGFTFTILAIYYFILGFIFINKIGVKEVKENLNLQHTFYTYIAISISIFSFSIALIFANRPEIITSVWLVEASVLFFLYNNTGEKRIFDFGLVIFIIGILKLFNIDVNPREYLFLISAFIILISLFLNVKFLDKSKDETRKNIHDIAHIVGIIAISYFVRDIIISHGHGLSILATAIFISILGIFYSKFGSKLLKGFFVFIFGLFVLFHLGRFDYIKYNLSDNMLEYLIFLQYISTILVSGIIIFWNKINKEKTYNYILNAILVFYLLIILSLYIYNIFENTFLITIFWGTVSSIALMNGILKDKKVLRTSGLYLLFLVLLKISLYDVWYGFENAFTRIIVFIVLGMILIFISIAYSKKYGNDLSGEFDFKNLLPKNLKKDEVIKEEKNEDFKEKDYKKLLTKDILKTNIDHIKEAQFYTDGKLLFKTKASNLIKIAFYVMGKEENYHFKANELKNYYEEISENFISELSSQNLKLVKNSFKEFVEKGGVIKLKNK